MHHLLDEIFAFYVSFVCKVTLTRRTRIDHLIWIIGQEITGIATAFYSAYIRNNGKLGDLSYSDPFWFLSFFNQGAFPLRRFFDWLQAKLKLKNQYKLAKYIAERSTDYLLPAETVYSRLRSWCEGKNLPTRQTLQDIVNVAWDVHNLNSFRRDLHDHLIAAIICQRILRDLVNLLGVARTQRLAASITGAINRFLDGVEDGSVKLDESGWPHKYLLSDGTHAQINIYRWEQRFKEISKNGDLAKDLKIVQADIDRLNSIMKCNRVKANEDKRTAAKLIHRIESRKNACEVDYAIEALWGRYYCLCYQPEQAIPHYENAISMGAYRAGDNIEIGLREYLLCLAFLIAVRGKKLKRKLRKAFSFAFLMGFITTPYNGGRESTIREFAWVYLHYFGELFAHSDKSLYEMELQKGRSMAFDRNGLFMQLKNGKPFLAPMYQSRTPTGMINGYARFAVSPLMIVCSQCRYSELVEIAKQCNGFDFRAEDGSTALTISLKKYIWLLSNGSGSKNIRDAAQAVIYLFEHMKDIDTVLPETDENSLSIAIDTWNPSLVQLVAESTQNPNAKCGSFQLNPLLYHMYKSVAAKKAQDLLGITEDDNVYGGQKSKYEFISGIFADEKISLELYKTDPVSLLHAAPVIRYPKDELEKDCVEIVCALVENGTELNATSPEGFNAAMYAVGADMPQVLRRLIALGADSQAANKHGYTALSLSLYAGRINCCKVLLEWSQRLAVNSPTRAAKNTPIIFAVCSYCLSHQYREQYLSIIRKLIGYGADTNHTNRMGLSAIYIAEHVGDNRLLTTVAGLPD